MKYQYKCQITIESDFISGRYDSLKCDKPAKFINPNPQMGVQYVCGIHANSLDKMFKRTGQNIKCLPLEKIVQRVAKSED